MQQNLKSVASMLLVTVVTLNLFMIALLAYTLHASYKREIEEVRTNVTNLALLMDQSVSGAATEIGLVVQEIQSYLETELRNGELQEDTVNALLVSRESWISDIAIIRVTDARGRVRFGSNIGAQPPADFTRNEFFIAHRDSSDAGLLVSKLIPSRFSQDWVHVFSRRYDDADGRFAGVITATVPASHFVRLISGLDLGPNGIALVRDLDKRLVARHPPLDAAPGHTGSVGGSQELTELLESGAQTGIFYSDGTADGIPRTDAFRRLSAMPVFVVAGLGEEDYLLTWRHDLTKALVLGLLFLLVTCIGACLLWRQIRASNRANRRSRMLLQHASDGIHILDSKGRLLEASDSFYKMLGYPVGDPADHSPYNWDALHTPQELSQLIASQLQYNRLITFETLFRHRDGHSFPVEVTSVLLEIDGQPLLFNAARDISERKQLDEDLRIAARAFESEVGMLITDAQLNILRCNQAFSRITGYSAEEVIGRQPNLLQSGRHDSSFYAGMWRALDQHGAWQGEIWNKRKNGEVYPQLLSIGTVNNEQGQTTHYVASLSDISARKATEEQMRTLAFYDSLTKLPNRRLFLERLEHALRTAQRHQTRGALLVVDLDNFKALNDTEGHAAGDQLLGLVATRLIDCVPHKDSVARLGGDEFVVLLDDLASHAIEAARQAELIGRDILAALAKPYLLAQSEYRGSASIGIALFGAGDTLLSEEPLRNADLAMSQAKAAGSNTLCFFDPQMQAQVRERSEIDAGLRIALEQQQFVLHYQPQVDAEGRITGAEALVRWAHPEHGMISPARFIPVAEENGLILPLGHWVLETACRQLAHWADDPRMAELSLAVNVSANQLSQPDFVAQVREILQRTGAPTRHLKLELTESALVNEIESTIGKMSELKGLGVCFSLDDFGTGYSSLTYLSRLPLDQLKIDQSFVHSILRDPNSGEIAQMIILLADRMGLSVLAEGVETQAQCAALQERGCHNFQGYLFGRPMTIEEFERELQ
ncbi:EAL domain-containing protein [Pseudomonas sp. MYb185]|uniref:bifunctional diguanylate cyclase/phosphodiesterase n=1 Tax=Pseudomonas sp. MYb185 TaxID=1848729 RepID=UPI000CFC7A26|nr:EAL domain-containing protein [Pseudomonas sp. MYb185]PRB78997.1 PAS domain S-box protein [Pseudomonas sp. MYb185]